MKRYLTVFFYETMEPVFLYKDTGSIALALAKYYNWKSTFAYLNICGNIQNETYEKYVELKTIEYNKNKFIKWFNIIKFIWKESKNYDVINFYFGGRKELLLALIAKMSKKKIKVYIKMDLVKDKYLRQINLSKKLSVKLLQFFSNLLSNVIDLYTVECKAYVNGLNNIKRFKNKIKYLPNGYFDDLVEIDKNINKEKIILTVGRLGTVEKNSEMLIEAIEHIDYQKLIGWKVYLVGPYTDKFNKYIKEKISNKEYLKEVFVITGNINDKKELYSLYVRSAVFVLPSIWESWGLALTEAMSFGCYPIVTDCNDVFKEILNYGDSGFAKIIPTKDVIALQEAIEDVILNNVDYINKGQQAKKFAESNLNYKNISRQLNYYLIELL